jgi:hypothetical protein
MNKRAVLLKPSNKKMGRCDDKVEIVQVLNSPPYHEDMQEQRYSAMHFNFDTRWK